MKTKNSCTAARQERIAKISHSLHIYGAWALAVALLLAATGAARAQPQVYFEDFDMDHSNDGTWVINSVGGYNPVNLHFDYSSVGIPPAPHSTGGTTRGLKLQAN